MDILFDQLRNKFLLFIGKNNSINTKDVQELLDLEVV